MRLLARLFSDDTVTNWTPQRAQQAEREMLKREGVVVEPVYLWSRPAQERERRARAMRLLRSAGQPTGKAQRSAPVKVAQFGRGRS